jgi:hypothetical protein
LRLPDCFLKASRFLAAEHCQFRQIRAKIVRLADQVWEREQSGFIQKSLPPAGFDHGIKDNFPTPGTPQILAQKPDLPFGV